MIDEIKQNADIDPKSEMAQEFADRWTALINEFTQGNQEVQSGLNDLWSDIDNAPSEMKTWYEQNKAAFEFINKVFASREK